MTLDETKRVLAAIALYEYRLGKPDKDVLEGWWQVLADLDVDDAVAAVVRYYAVNTDRIMPGHIRAGVKEIRAERRRREPSEALALPSRFEQDLNRAAHIERGVATVRQILGRYTEHLAAQRTKLPSALEQLRELTSGAEVIDLGEDDVVEGEGR